VEAAARGLLHFIKPGGSADDHTKAETAVLLKGDDDSLLEFGDAAKAQLANRVATDSREQSVVPWAAWHALPRPARASLVCVCSFAGRSCTPRSRCCWRRRPLGHKTSCPSEPSPPPACSTSLRAETMGSGR